MSGRRETTKAGRRPEAGKTRGGKPAPRARAARATKAAAPKGARRPRPVPVESMVPGWWKIRRALVGPRVRPGAAPAPTGETKGLPQLDTGIFACRHVENEWPRAWVWCVKNGAPGDFEYWMQFVAAHPAIGVYSACTSAWNREHLVLSRVAIADPMGQPMNDARVAAHRAAFHRAVIQYYVTNGIANPPVAGNFQKCLLQDVGAASIHNPPQVVDPGQPAALRVVGPGVYSVHQLSNPAETMLPLAWAWVPGTAGAEQVWITLPPDPANPNAPVWKRPGAGHVLCRAWIEFEQAPPAGWNEANFAAWIRATWAHVGSRPLAVEHLRAADVT